MKISYNWLREYINTDKSAEEVAELLTNCGLEVESTELFQTVKGGLKGVVVGEVLTKAKHPDADKLSVTTVNIGDNQVLNIVCGAPNVEEGQKVLVATIDTKLYKGEDSFVIKKSKIRGVVSEGMICAEDELGLGESHAGIMVLDSSAKIGMPAKDYFRLTDDIVFEIGLTPNRPDATSHIGVARDLNAVLAVHSPQSTVHSQQSAFSNKQIKLNIPDVDAFKVDNNDRKIEVIVEDNKACPRYSGLTISGITIKESPEWLKNRMKSIGLRPINNIVDITNYVMMETGQPLHAFDADKIKGNKVIVKKLSKGTKFITLDGTERELTEIDLMICNEEEGMCIAGVFGGLGSGISDKTTSLFLESANFNLTSIRKTSKYHGLSTDSSFRFERGADPNITVYALKRAAILIKEIAGGKVSSDIADVYPEPFADTIINIDLNNINKFIGKTIDKSVIVTILESLGIKIIKETTEQNSIQLALSIPLYKSDVKREVDIIEEILRIYGYNNVEIPGEVRLSIKNYELGIRNNKIEKLKNTVSDYLSNNSFFEIYCNSLTKSTYSETIQSFNPDNNVKVLHPISKELNVMRQTLLFGGLETIQYNYNRKQHDLKLYEFGNTYKSIKTQDTRHKTSIPYTEESHLAIFMTGRRYNETWNTTDGKVDFYDIKYYVNNILSLSGIDISKLTLKQFNDDIFDSGLTYEYETEKEIASFGEINKSILELFDIKTGIYYSDIYWDKLIKLSEKNIIKFKELPKYPEVRRDIAMLIDKGIKYSDIESLAYQTERKLLKKVDLFDVYEGEKIDTNKKSYAISLILQNNEKTLTDNEVDKVMDKIRSAITDKFNAIIR